MPGTVSRARALSRNRQVPRVPLPKVGVTSLGETWSASSEDIAPRSSLLWTHAPIPLALPSFGSSPRSRSLGRLLPAPAANGIFPTLSLQIFPQMPGPLPRRSHRVLLPVSSSMSSAFPKTLWVGFPFLSANATFPRVSFSRLQTFRYVQASEFARLPDPSSRFEVTPTKQPRLLHPDISCFVASARSGYAIRPIQAIDGKGLSPFKICSLVGCSSASLTLPTT